MRNFRREVEAARLKGVADAGIAVFAKADADRRRRAEGRIRRASRARPASSNTTSPSCCSPTRTTRSRPRAKSCPASPSPRSTMRGAARPSRPRRSVACGWISYREALRKALAAMKNGETTKLPVKTGLRLARCAPGDRQSVHAAAVRPGQGRHPPQYADEESGSSAWRSCANRPRSNIRPGPRRPAACQDRATQAPTGREKG